MLKQAFLENNMPPSHSELTWVYIFLDKESMELNIGFTFNLHKRFSKADTLEKPIYYRSFSSPFDALAHKHLLDCLTKESVMHQLRQLNPKLNNLIPEISDG